MKRCSLLLAAVLALSVIFTGCKAQSEAETSGASDKDSAAVSLVLKEHVRNEYAEQFSIDRYEGGYSMITTMNGARFLVVPEGADVPGDLDKDITVICQPAENFYIAATSAMGLFAEVGALDAVKFSGAKAEDWYVDAAKEAMDSGKIVYAGKYREPDYEMLLSGGCTLSIQSTMIEHSPAVKEKLASLGIPVFIDYASYEPHPLGRSEWIKVYAEMCGKADEADRVFSEQSARLKTIEGLEGTGKTAAFFYINSAGQAVTRRSGDYITKMIELAGGESVFEDAGGESGSSSVFSTVVMEMEKFYTQAKDADFIIYNSTIGGEISTVEELIAKNSLLADFKAVKTGNVWCTHENVYQETTKLGTMIFDFHSVFSGTAESEPPTFLYKLESGEAG
ncbi:MAG: ABC transporter substrate-binding protein [Oscillospiraceae bacterium]|nr:ABC transporter substrate-binding protein [Oscillospiraceae bacterium]